VAEHEPRCHQQQRQGDDEPDGENAKLLPESGFLVPAACRHFQRRLRLALSLKGLIDLQQLRVEALRLRLRRSLA
jgi:hypothetical protein